MSKEKQIQIIAGKGVDVLELREGAALPLHGPVKIAIIGQIDAVSRFILQRGDIDKKTAIIEVDRDNMQICFSETPKEFDGTEIVGKLSLSKEYLEFGINTKETYTAAELADFIKMNRSFFSKKEEANKLVAVLRNFTAKVTKDIADKDDKRGNTEAIRRQVVESNLPGSFKLKIAVFKGQNAVELEVEINVDPRSLECYLISADANDIINETSNGIIETELKKLEGFCIIEK
jgi:hypothetical protein